jgi:integrase
MASVRKRTWTSGGKTKTAWTADYFDQSGKRHQQAFPTRGAADAFLLQARGEVVKGIHMPDFKSITVAEACQLWLEKCEQKELARKTLYLYRAHVDLHIVPLIGAVKLAKLSTPAIEAYCDELVKRTTRKTARETLVKLKSVLDEAQRRGLASQNVARPVRIYISARARRKVGIGVDVPSDEDVRTLMNQAGRFFRPLLITVISTGMRSGELRALTWDNVDFERKRIRVRQGADDWGTIGRPKTGTGEREIPMSQFLINTLEKWKEDCPPQGRLTGFLTYESKVLEIARLIEANPRMSNRKIAKQVRAASDAVARVKKAMPISSNSRLWLVFPNAMGGVQSRANIFHHLTILQRRIGMFGPDGKTKYTMHSFRHFFASWHIKQGYPLKRLQAILGHATASMTLDTYGHLFGDPEDDDARFEAGGRALLGGLRLQQK